MGQPPFARSLRGQFVELAGFWVGSPRTLVGLIAERFPSESAEQSCTRTGVVDKRGEPAFPRIYAGPLAPPPSASNLSQVPSMLRAPAFLYRLVDNEIGATMVEYGLMASLIAAACMATVSLIGTNMSAMFTMIAGTI